MICVNHKNEIAIEKCSVCGQWYCENCVTIDNIKATCNRCLGKETPNREQTVIREVIGEPKVDNDPKVIIKPMSSDASRRPRTIISNGEEVDVDNIMEIEEHNRRMKYKITKGQKNYVVNYNTEKLKKSIWRIGAGLIVASIGSGTFISIIGIVIIITGIIDFKESRS